MCALTCISVTAARYLLKSFMSAQASFDPPGLSVAVKKDRAAEALLSPGAKFIVNIMAEGHERPLMKQLLKPFKPGEDRFAGLDIEVDRLACPPTPGVATVAVWWRVCEPDFRTQGEMVDPILAPWLHHHVWLGSADAPIGI
jgi:flavin reductase (DIM6/NTAB) family NADH-FMN oxidoreductase RutF